MKFLRYEIDGQPTYGVLTDSHEIERLSGNPLKRVSRTGATDVLDKVRVLPPIETPRVFGLGYNYLAHARETNKPIPEQPVLFMKPSTSVIGHGDAILYPSWGENIHFEGELVIVIGKRARHVSEADALEVIFGYTCGNDVSDRVLQRRESAFGCLLAGKGYDTFAPLGPVISDTVDPRSARIQTRVNGSQRQDASVADMHFSVPEIISYLSRYITLLPGDLIMTGTPDGVGPLAIGDVIEIEIEGIGTLRNHVAADPATSTASLTAQPRRIS